MSHTPGPWSLAYPILREMARIPRGVAGGDGWGVCEMSRTHPPEETAANAYLIHAAPELLEELENTRQDLAQMVADGIIEYYDFSTIDAAIAKAKGDENA